MDQSGQWQEDLQSTEYVEGRALKWIKQLEQLADLALRPQGDLPPDYDLAAKISGPTRSRASVGSGWTSRPRSLCPACPTSRSYPMMSSGVSNWATTRN